MRRAQNQIHTYLFRRPDVLRAARAQLAAPGGGKLRVLSFGCSTGEEIVTLRWFFPDAEIFGCDTEPDILEIAEASVGHLATIFKSDGDAIEARGPFDLINCSSVLCLNPPTDIAGRFPSARFDEIVALLDGVLRPGGLIAITNASYRFAASGPAPHYDPVRADIVSSAGSIDVFGHDGRVFLERIAAPPHLVFRRGPAFDLRDPEELADCLFRKRPIGEKPAPRMLRLAPVPTRFQSEFEFQSSNLVGLDTAQRVDAIEIVRRYRFGVDAATGEPGCAIEIGWDGPASGAKHVRPPIWRRLTDGFMED